MAPRGRKPQFVPKQIGNANFKLYVPGRGIVDLGTKDEKEAWTKAGQYAQEWAAEKGTTVSQPQAPVKVDGPTAESMIKSWTQSPDSSTAFSQPSPVTPSPSVSASPQPTQPSLPGFAPSTSAPTVREKVAEIMPTDRRKKVADLMAKGMMRLNVAACALTVNLLGRVPGKESDDESEEVLQEGWSLQLEEWFVDHPPAPWMVILGGSMSVGIGMYMNGTPKPPKNQLNPPGGDNGIPDIDESGASAG